MCLQPSSYILNRCPNLREEYICSVYGRMIQNRINFLFKHQLLLRKESEIRNGSVFDENEKDLDEGIKTYVPANLTGSHAYWKKVADSAFFLTLILGSPKFFITITENSNWNEIAALNNSNDIMMNSPLLARVFYQKKLCLIDFIKKSKMFGNISGMLWRDEYQKRGMPHSHILIWSDFDTEDPIAVDQIITCSLPKRDPVEINNEKWNILKKKYHKNS